MTESILLQKAWRLVDFAEVLAKFLLLLCSMIAGLAWADEGSIDPSAPATVYTVRKNKLGPYLVFDQGHKTGFVVGRRVCFYGVDNVKVSCAPVVRTRSRAAAAYITQADSERVQAGFFVWPEDLGSLKLQPLVTPEQQPVNQDIEDLIQEEDDPPEVILPPLLSSRLQVHLSPTVSLPVWLSDLRFNASARAAGKGDIWRSGDTVMGSVVGFGARYYRALNGRGDSSVDITYHFVPQRPVKDNFDVTDAAVAVKSSVWAHHYRIRWMRGATWIHDANSDLLLYFGLGYDFMRAKFKTEYVGAAAGELVSGDIRAHAVEVPLIATWQRYFGDWFLSAGVDASLPLGVFGVTSRGTLSYDEQTSSADKSLDGAVEAISVRRGWFSFAMQMGLGAVF